MMPKLVVILKLGTNVVNNGASTDVNFRDSMTPRIYSPYGVNDTEPLVNETQVLFQGVTGAAKYNTRVSLTLKEWNSRVSLTLRSMILVCR
jgi:hypothetical protein